MKIYSAQKNISFHPKFAQTPIVENTLKLVKETNNASCTSLIGGLINNETNIVREAQDVFVKTITEAEKEAQSILANYPQKEKILNIIRESNEELQKIKLEFLKVIKNITMTEDEYSYLLRLLEGNFTKEPIIAKVWGLCLKKEFIFTLL